jgi:hypothetical protein
MKICRVCKLSKPFSEFHKDNYRKDGLQNKCISCERQYQIDNQNHLKEYRSQYYESNKQHEQDRHKKYRQEHIEFYRNYDKKYVKLNPGKKNFLTRKRRLTRIKATPKWLTSEQLAEIEWFYTTAKELQWLSEEPLEVDHIIPLNGKNVCGLHVPWNLQIIPKGLNCRKKNKLYEELQRKGPTPPTKG